MDSGTVKPPTLSLYAAAAVCGVTALAATAKLMKGARDAQRLSFAKAEVHRRIRNAHIGMCERWAALPRVQTIKFFAHR